MRKWMIVGLCLLVGFGIFVRAKTADVNAIDSAEGLALLFNDHQHEFLPVGPPSEDVFVQGFSQAVPVNWKRFPRDFAQQMFPEVDADGYPIYPMSIYEDASTRDIVFLNMYGDEVHREPPADGYDPYAWQAEYFGLEPGE